MKIYVATTFREFRNNQNDEIQRSFINSLVQSKSQNVELIVTLFGERNVEREIKKYPIKATFFDSSGQIGGHRYSHSLVLLNAIDYALKQNDDFVIVWSTCDIIYENNFFRDIINLSEKYENFMFTSHPQINLATKKTYSFFSGFDCIGFSSKIIANEKIINIIEKTIFYDWGLFEHFLISLNEFFDDIFLINFFPRSKIYKHENDRNLTKETLEFLHNSWKLNSEVFKQFLSIYKLSPLYFDLRYCHFKFKSEWMFRLKYPREYLLYFLTIVKYQFKNYLKNFINIKKSNRR